MKLLTPKQVHIKKEAENLRLAQRGLMLAKKIDELVAKYKEKEMKLKKEHEQLKDELSSEIIALEKRRTQLRNEVK